MIPICTIHKPPGFPILCNQCRRAERTMPADRLADRWRRWCGDTAWTAAMDEFAMLGGFAEDWGGVPQSRSAIPLTFALILPDGSYLPDCRSRVADIRRAITLAREFGRLI